MHYPDKLKQFNLPTLTYRRSRSDMIETYKLLTGKYDPQVALALPKNVTGEYFTRGNSNKLLVKRCRYELRKNFLSNRIVNMWNSLHDYVIMSDTINTFKKQTWCTLETQRLSRPISLSWNLHRNRRLEKRLNMWKLMSACYRCGLRGDAYVYISQWWWWWIDDDISVVKLNADWGSIFKMIKQ